ncbi:unnamed protein product [Dicrocoelium dendriticum]|nr:unnamed protein product [Dicrocoelium dendriticum]
MPRVPPPRFASAPADPTPTPRPLFSPRSSDAISRSRSPDFLRPPAVAHLIRVRALVVDDRVPGSADPRPASAPSPLPFPPTSIAADPTIVDLGPPRPAP